MRLRSTSGTRRALWIVALIFVVSLPAVTTRFYASDEVEYFAWLHSVWFDHDANFDNEYQHFYDNGTVHNALFHETFLELSNETGRRYNFTPIGCAILWTPFFAAGHVVALISGAPADGYGRPYVAAVSYGSAIYGFAAVFLTIAIVRRILGGGLGSALATWIGTPLLFYIYVAPGFAHACSAFAVSLFLWTWLTVRSRWTVGGAVALGITGALMAMVREQDAFFIAGPALDFMTTWFASVNGRSAVSAGNTFVRSALAGAGAFLVTYSPQLVAYKALNGHFSPTAKVSGKMTWTAPHFFGVLFSPEHGLFVWTPLAFVGLVGLVWLTIGPRMDRSPDVRWLGALALVMFVLQAYVSGSVESWTVAGSFGQRRFVAVTPLIALGLSALAPVTIAARSWLLRAASAAVVVLCIWWNLGLMAQFGLHTMDRQRLSLRDNARETFVDLPGTAPALVWRYVFARSSFYSLPQQ